MAKVSVLIPVYNVEKYLRQCLDSVVNQTLHDIEIICVNDCSPDNSLSILKEYAQKDDRIKIIDLKERIWTGNNRNLSLTKVTSEYIMFLDSDDYIDNNVDSNSNQIKPQEKSDKKNSLKKSISKAIIINRIFNKKSIRVKEEVVKELQELQHVKTIL